MAIRQTSDRIYGQIYVPVVNWLLMVATIAMTIAFGSSDRLAGAYGTAVSTTMLLTTMLLYRAMRDVWRWPLAVAIAVAGVFLIVDSEFLPRQSPEDRRRRLAALDVSRPSCSSIMITWREGVDAIRATLVQSPQAAEKFLSDLKSGVIPRVEGTTVFLTQKHAESIRG